MKPKMLIRSLVAAGALSLAALGGFVSGSHDLANVFAAPPAVVATAQPAANATVPTGHGFHRKTPIWIVAEIIFSL